MKDKVKIYTTPTCGFCEMAKAFLSEQEIEYSAYDVSKDMDALREMIKISGGARSVPVLSICNEVMVGFDRDRVKQALNCLKQSSEV